MGGWGVHGWREQHVKDTEAFCVWSQRLQAPRTISYWTTDVRIPQVKGRFFRNDNAGSLGDGQSV